MLSFQSKTVKKKKYINLVKDVLLLVKYSTLKSA